MDEYTMTWSDAAREEATATALGTGTWVPVATTRALWRDGVAREAGPRSGWLRRLQMRDTSRAGAASCMAEGSRA